MGLGSQGGVALLRERLKRVTLFRRLLPWLFAVAVIANCWELATLTVLHWNGTTGVETPRDGTSETGPLQPDTSPFERRLATVSDPALAAGFRPGDRVDSRELFRANGFANPIPGVPYQIVAHRAARTLAAPIVPTQAPLDPSQIVRLVAVFWSIGFALLIAIRGGPTRENALLLTVLLAVATVSASDRIVWPDSRLTFLTDGMLSPIFWNTACIALVLYAQCFGRPLSSPRIVLSAVVYVATAFDLVRSAVANSTTFLYPWTDPNSGIAGMMHWGGIFNWDQLLLALLCVGAAIPAARPGERQRLGWVIASFTPYVAGVAIGTFSDSAATWAIQNASYFFIPAGLTYAALAKRMFDVTFVVNRAAVFAGVSVVVVGAFVLVEWALGKWFENVSHATSLAVNAGLALILGFSIRFVHQRIDAAVDNVFFRKRHENETALRRFAREAAFFTDVETLVERACATILSHSEVTTAEIVMASEIDPNDAAVVAMRAWNEPADLSDCDTSLRGEMAFPMLAHGTFVGAAVCGPKRTGERYAPDEIEAIRELAHGVGVAIDNLERDVRDGSSLTQIAAMFASISKRLDELTGRARGTV